MRLPVLITKLWFTESPWLTLWFPHSITQASRADLWALSTAIRDRQADSCWQLCLFLSCCLWSVWSLTHSVPTTHSTGDYLTPPGAQRTCVRTHTHTHIQSPAQAHMCSSSGMYHGSTFIQVPYWCINLRYLYFTWVDFHYSTSQGIIVAFYVTTINEGFIECAVCCFVMN